MVWLAALVPFIGIPIIILRKKGCTAEINVIWYAFSLILVILWSINFALELLSIHLAPVSPTDVEKVFYLSPYYQWVEKYYKCAKEYLTETRAELGLVASILIVTIAPQFLNYILSGFSGCAATPRLVWQFEKIATWSLIKFLAAFGGVFVADAIWRRLNSVDRLLWGLSAVGLAFIIAVFQVYALEAADALGKAWQRKPKSWPYRLHRFFARNLPREENEPAKEAEPVTFDAREIWDKLTPAQQQQVGALAVRSLLGGRPAEKNGGRGLG
jgi:hypothetical protein